ncbi:hypothetical protein ACIA5D_32720 [Actinoplanes sp. NPDC051513]|uniref:hypothetical protein n=1 Tax=Actinoplanes sp. NPDC051513 TaxID=3363908 RepID=UPI0037A0D9EC
MHLSVVRIVAAVQTRLRSERHRPGSALQELSPEIVVDLRATGMRVRLDSDEHAAAVSYCEDVPYPGVVYACRL